MTSFTISKTPAPLQLETLENIEEKLLSALAKVNAQTNNASIVLTANNDDGELLGGITGATSYGWLLIKMLWVSEDKRRSGIGKQLVSSVENEGRALKCHSAWLDTSNAKARNFYLRLGYEDFGVLENGPNQVPSDHCRWFMKKAL